MLSDEMERALDWRLPPTLTDGQDLVATIVMTPRQFMPGGILAMNYFPILADPESLLAVIVPTHYWEVHFRTRWSQEADATIDNIRQRRKAQGEELKKLLKTPKDVALFIKLTPSARDRVREIIKDSKLKPDETCLRIGVQSLEFILKSTISEKDAVLEVDGLSLVIAYGDLYDLRGTTLDFRKQGGAIGFTFDHPQMNS